MEKRDYKDSVINKMENYFDELWEHDFSESPQNNLSQYEKEKGKEKRKEFNRKLNKVKKKKPHFFGTDFNWDKKTFPVKNISFIHNPIERLNKEPKILYDIIELMENSEKSIFLQSPYIVPINDMLENLNLDNINVDVRLLTNSKASTPSYFATSGYIKYRKELADFAELHEYQKPGTIHAKTYVFDSRINVVGSFNLDPRSTYLSTESMVVIDSKELAIDILPARSFSTHERGFLQRYRKVTR